MTEMMSAARDAATVQRVFAPPYERDGTTVIAAASVTGGGGGGSGTDPQGQEGEGGGFGAGARPVGAYVIQGGRVSWLPAVDANRLVAVVGVIVIAYLLRRPRARGGRRGRAGA